jgi:hypothetical protein
MWRGAFNAKKSRESPHKRMIDWLKGGRGAFSA